MMTTLIQRSLCRVALLGLVLAPVAGAARGAGGPDWLISTGFYPAVIKPDAEGKNLLLSNGLVTRTIRLIPNAATVDFRNLMTGEEIVRAVRPEAILEIDGKRYKVGGLEGQIEQAYLMPQWLEQLTSDPSAFQYVGYDVGAVEERFAYKPSRWSTGGEWPPKGRSLTVQFRNRSRELEGVLVEVHYEIYDGIPLISKWLTVRNNGSATIQLDSYTSENLAVVEPEVAVDIPDQWERPNIHIESDYEFMGMSPKTANRTVRWVTDSGFTSQVNYNLQTPCVLECRPPYGPGVTIAPGETFDSFRVYELIFDSSERERKGLAIRRMYRTVSPWVTENPIFLHLTSTDPAVVRRAVDQCADVGFEMVILSFGSGVNMESDDERVIGGMRDLVDYARGKGIELGGYSLLASRRISEEDDVINPATGKTGGAVFGNSPCLCSSWGAGYFRHLRNFIEKTGFAVLEHDGSYPGDLCASVKHPGHAGLNDSQWKQWKVITDFYTWCRGRDIYLNVPDWYFLSGSNKTGIGYREVNWSLPRDRQIMLGRQNIFDGTWQKTPSMGWTFVPLVEYQGGGAAATIEPLSEHLDAYRAHLVQNFGAGVQACYRGPRLYDTEETRALVRQWVAWYKKYRAILNSDIIHMHRPDGRDLDCMLHVNPALSEKGLLMVYNPLKREVTKTLTLPLYYTGLSEEAKVREQEGPASICRLTRKYEIEIPVTVPPGGFTWFVIE